MMVEIQIPTGYRVEEKDLKSMVKGYYVRNLRDAENWPGQVNFGFEYVDFTPICFQFQAKRWIPVANITRYYEVKAYELFEPGNMFRNVFVIRNLFALDICEVKIKQENFLTEFSFSIHLGLWIVSMSILSILQYGIDIDYSIVYDHSLSCLYVLSIS